MFEWAIEVPQQLAPLETGHVLFLKTALPAAARASLRLPHWRE